tara:strand:+ start:1741 stop:1920 length:180 start_codon:yes stop_codon:yes gene_type:complete
MNTTEKFYTIEEVAAILGINKTLLYSWRQRNYGPTAHKFGGLLRWSDTDLKNWLTTRRS